MMEESFKFDAPLIWIRMITSRGDIKLATTPETWGSPNAATVLIHGAAGQLQDLFPVASVVPNPIFVALPGHQVPRLPRNRLTDWIGAIEESLNALQRPLFVVGESLGGLIALSLPYDCVAIDPPLRTDNLWPVWKTLKKPGAHGLRDLLDPMFAPNQDFRPLVRGGTVLTGDVPLLPPRDLRDAPCIFEPEIAPASVGVQTLKGGHALLREHTAACLEAILAAMP